MRFGQPWAPGPLIVDLLRNEEPVFLMSMDLDDAVLTAITTGSEAVGEGEIRTLIQREKI